MSEDNIHKYSKSHSEGELINDSDKMSANRNQADGSRLKRTFTLPRNPFSSNKIGKNRSKQKVDDLNFTNAQTELNVNAECNGKQGKKVFRRTSWKKFINKIAQHMNTVGVTSSKHQQQEWSNRVPPVNFDGDYTPGVTGLRNHGNTCFMNAVLQCLSHTDMIAEYFVLDAYKADLSRRSRTNSRKLGTRGELTEQLALLLKALWAGQYYPELSTTFKAIVERYGTQYRGSSQHDAQEFLLWLLDKVHEDLNTATKKKYKTIKNTTGRPDEVIAAETLANHLRCNSSFVQAVFQAQFRSSLACPRCHRQSNTFDPFHCISVQLPHLPDHPILITVVYANQQPRCVRLGIRMPANSMVRDLRSLLHSDTGIALEDIILVEITDTGFGRTLSDCQPVWLGGCPTDGVAASSLSLYCVEAPPLCKDPPPEPYILLMWINVLVDGDNTERFGSPYSLQVPREIGYDDLQKLMLKEMLGMVNESILGQQQSPGQPKLRMLSPIVEPTHYLQDRLEHPLYTEAVEQTLALSGERSGPQHLQLIAEWNKQLRERLLTEWNENVEQHSSVGEVMESPECTPRLSLSDCLNHYTRAETLAMEDAWRCPQCQQYLPVVKTLGLWSLPDILVIHLKRFRQQQVKGRNSTKLTTMVEFPLHGFDMTPHLANKETPSNNGGIVLGGAGWSPWKKPRKISTYTDNFYDLYSVCYHHGNDLETGHYTAACRNPYDQQWYKFDDTRVTHISSEDVNVELVNNSAYILFYQRRHGQFVSCSSNSSSAASTSSVGSNNEHWSVRMPRFTYRPKKDAVTERVNTAPNVKVSQAKCRKSPAPSEGKNGGSDLMGNNFPETMNGMNPKSSVSSLQEVSSCVQQLGNSLVDENNLRNSISLSDNLTVSTGDVGDNQEQVLDMKPEEMINKNSIFNMGESRRNTLSEYKNIDNEFILNGGDDSSIMHRNSLSLTVTPYPAHKDIHVNPKMTVKTIKANEIFKVDMSHSKQHASGNKEKVINPELEQLKMEFRQFKSGLTHSEMRREVESWMRSSGVGWRGYGTLSSVQRYRSDIPIKDTLEKEHHSDDEAPLPPEPWKSPSSISRPVIVTRSDK